MIVNGLGRGKSKKLCTTAGCRKRRREGQRTCKACHAAEGRRYRERKRKAGTNETATLLGEFRAIAERIADFMARREVAAVTKN